MRDSVLYTLAQSGYAGIPEMATQPASVFDPLLRPFIKMQVRGAISKANASTKSSNAEHALRLAFLQKLGMPQGVGVDDEAAVAEAFKESAKRYEAPRKPTRLLTGLVSIALLLGAGAFVYFKFFRKSDEARFISSPLGIALAEPLTRYSQTNVSGKRDAARKDILAEPVKKQIGEGAFKLLEEVLDAPGAFLTSKDPPEQAVKQFTDKVRQFNESLEKKQIPGFIGADVNVTKDGTKSSALFAFQVHERATVTVKESKIDVTWGYRLDQGRGGWKAVDRPADADWAYVNLDTVAAAWPQLIIPVVMQQKPVIKDAPKEVTDFEKLVGKIIREEMKSCVGLDDATLERLADEIQQRDDRYKQVEKNFKLEEVMDRPTVFQTPAARLELAKMKDDALVAEALDWDDRLRGDYEPLTKAIAPFAELTEESFLYGTVMKEKFVGTEKPLEKPPSDDDGERPTEAAAPADDPTSAEVAGKLAALTRDRRCYKMQVAYMLHSTVRALSTVHRRADVKFLGGLLRELGLASDETWNQSGLDKAALGSTLSDALGKSPADFKSAATKAYEKYFGRGPVAYDRTTR